MELICVIVESFSFNDDSMRVNRDAFFLNDESASVSGDHQSFGGD